MENGGVTPDLGLWDSDVAWVRQLIPAGLQVSTLPYGTIDIDWIVNGCYKGKILGHVCFSRSAKNGEAHSEVEDFAHHQLKGVVDDEPIIGVSNPNAGGTTDLGVESGNIGQGAAAAVVDVGRPLTDVAHEIGHMFGLVHASKSCGGGTGGNVGQPWPPDQQGYIDGIGLNLFDPAPSQPGIYGPSYPVVAGTPPGDASHSPPPQQFYDFMSYCASPNNNPDPSPGSSVNPAVDSSPADRALGDSDAWISSATRTNRDRSGASTPGAEAIRSTRVVTPRRTRLSTELQRGRRAARPARHRCRRARLPRRPPGRE